MKTIIDEILSQRLDASCPSLLSDAKQNLNVSVQSATSTKYIIAPKAILWGWRRPVRKDGGIWRRQQTLLAPALRKATASLLLNICPSSRPVNYQRYQLTHMSACTGTCPTRVHIHVRISNALQQKNSVRPVSSCGPPPGTCWKQFSAVCCSTLFVFCTAVPTLWYPRPLATQQGRYCCSLLLLSLHCKII